MTAQQLPRITALKAFLWAASDSKVGTFDTIRYLSMAFELLPADLIAAMISFADNNKSDKWLKTEIKKAGFEL